MVRRVVTAAGIVLLYVVFLPALRLLGPRPAVPLSRLAAWAHWLLTFVGFERVPRQALTASRAELGTNLPVRGILRRYLEVKYQHLVEQSLYPTVRGRRFVAATYRPVVGREHLDAAVREGRGVIVLAFHFGLCRMIFPALESLGYETHQHIYRESSEAATTFAWVARLSDRAVLRTERAGGLSIIYHRPSLTFPLLVRHLQRGAILGMNADGMATGECVEVPFLGGTIRLQSGPARLAARAGTPLVPAFCLPEGLYGHRLVLHAPLRVADGSDGAVRQAVRDYVAVLEDYVRRYPWGWSIWRRLGVGCGADGRRDFSLMVWGGAAGEQAPSLAGAPAVPSVPGPQDCPLSVDSGNQP